jgi:very-short-patch-repair endonuclease
LWAELRGHRLTDLHFRRQAPIGPFIADFACHAAKLIVELDGGQHASPQHAARDATRDAWFAARGYLTLRFWSHEVFESLNAVTDTIFAHCAERLPPDHTVNSPLPHPPPQGGMEAEPLTYDFSRTRRLGGAKLERSLGAIEGEGGGFRPPQQFREAP